MATTEQFSLRWNNFYSNITTGFHELLQAHDLVDVTLSVEGRFLQAHKIVLSICSPFFKQIFKVNPCKHPVIVLRDVTYGNLKDILEFMYLGEVNVLRDNLSAFLRTAELLQVKGLTGDDSSDTSSRQDDRSDSTCCENDLEHDIHQLIEPKSPLMPIPLTTSTSSLPQIPICNMKRPKNTNNNNNKRTKADGHKRNEDEEFMEPHLVEPKLENDDNSATNNEIIKQLLENNLAGHEPSITQEDGMLFSMDPKGHVYCPYCYRKFVNRYNLKVHIRDKHDNNPINLDCIICGKTMRNRSCLRVHLYHHRKQQEQVQLEQTDTAESKNF